MQALKQESEEEQVEIPSIINVSDAKPAGGGGDCAC
jgi:hypothetical protein|eukprot:COSAG02_NODE_73_length_41919_cov_6.571066_3_plen_36_part_00